MKKTYKVEYIQSRIVEEAYSAEIIIDVEEDDNDFDIEEKLTEELNGGNVKNEVFLKNIDDYLEKIDLEIYNEI